MQLSLINPLADMPVSVYHPLIKGILPYFACLFNGNSSQKWHYIFYVLIKRDVFRFLFPLISVSW